MAKSLPLSLEHANDLRQVENDAKIASNDAIGELFATVNQFHWTSILIILFMTADRENLCNKLKELAHITEAASFRAPRMSKPDSSTGMEKQDTLSKIDEIIRT